MVPVSVFLNFKFKQFVSSERNDIHVFVHLVFELVFVLKSCPIEKTVRFHDNLHVIDRALAVFLDSFTGFQSCHSWRKQELSICRLAECCHRVEHMTLSNDNLIESVSHICDILISNTVCLRAQFLKNRTHSLGVLSGEFANLIGAAGSSLSWHTSLS